MQAKSKQFVRQHTQLEPVPLVPEIRIHTATDVTPIWTATQDFLEEHDLGIPFWCVPWAGGQALARWVLDHPSELEGRRVLDFGTGSGLVAIAAALVGANVHAVDIDPFAVTAAEVNAAVNRVTFTCECVDLADARVDADVILAGDVWYERDAAARFERWFKSLTAAGVQRVITGDPGRSYVPADAIELGRYDVPTTLDLESKTSVVTRVLAL